VEVFEDIWGSWGGMSEEKDSIVLDKVLESWTVSECAILQEGPEQAVLWTRWQGKNSWLDLTYSLRRGEDALRVSARMLWNERSARIKLVFPSNGPLRMQTPASSAERAQAGHLPCGRWFRRGSEEKGLAFVSDVLSDLDTSEDKTRVTIARASRYADDVPTAADKARWRPATDCGELKFQFILAAPSSDLERLAEELLHAPVTLPVPPHPGSRPPKGSLAEIQPSHVTLLSASIGDGGALKVRVQNQSSEEALANMVLDGVTLKLGSLRAGEIKTFTVNSDRQL
jgi:alpha-mannosidase